MGATGSAPALCFLLTTEPHTQSLGARMPLALPSPTRELGWNSLALSDPQLKRLITGIPPPYPTPEMWTRGEAGPCNLHLSLGHIPQQQEVLTAPPGRRPALATSPQEGSGALRTCTLSNPHGWGLVPGAGSQGH